MTQSAKLRSLILARLALVVSALVMSHGADAADGAIEISQPATFITQPGSYVLTNDVEKIVVNASDATVDLNGFTVGHSTDVGIDIRGTNVEVRNGTVRGHSQMGIRGTNTAHGLRVIDVRLIENGFIGLNLQNDDSLVRGCTVSRNHYGIVAGDGSMLIDNVITDNTTFGLLTRDAATFGRNILVRNNGGGPQADLSLSTIEIAPNVCGTDTFCQ